MAQLPMFVMLRRTGKKYELSNHLGNVLAVVSDNINLDQDSTWASVVNTTDYYPFGLAMDGHTVQDSAYRYGFNGKEIQNDHNLGLYDYGARFYDPTIGRWLSIDPMAHLREWLSPYNFVQHNPLNRVDPDGRFDWVANKDGEVYLDENATSQATTKTGETYLGKSGTGLDEQTGNTLVYNSDGAVGQGVRTLGEVTVSASQSDHERTMSNPVVQGMKADNDRMMREAMPFARHMVRSTIDGVGYTEAGISAVGTVVTPFVPHIGLGLLTVGGTVSSASGLASAGMNFLEGNYGSAMIDVGMVGLRSAGPAGLKALKNRQIINTTDEVVLWSVYNSSIDILGIVIVPKIKE